MTPVKEYPTSWGQRVYTLCYCAAFVLLLWLGWDMGWLYRVFCGASLVLTIALTKSMWKTWIPVEPHWSDYR